MGPNANALARVDVSRLVRLQSLPAEELARIDAILVEYDRAAAELARKYFDAEVKMNDVQQRWSWELSRTSREGRQMERAMQYQEAMREPQRALGQVARQVADLNETTIEQLLSNVSPSYSESLFAAYNRRAFPTVYRDASSVNDHLLSAMRLPDLTESQRSQLAELLAEYRPTYAAMTDDMVVIARELGPGFSWAALDQDDWSRIANVQERMAKVRFERNELNSRAITQIKSILNDTQLAQLTPLPQPVEHASSAWDF